MLTTAKISHSSLTFIGVFSVLAIAISLILPQKTFGNDTARSMLFPRETSSRASVLFVGKSKEPFEPSAWSTYITVTSYNSVPEQTDSTPFITASGTRTRDGIIATNYLPIGTRVRFPELYGSKVFTVEDRMNSRYYKRADIWAEDVQFSRHFGARYLKMEVLES